MNKLHKRLNRILPQDRKTLIIPVDHGLGMGNVAGLEDPKKLLISLHEQGVHGTLMSAGLAKHMGKYRGDMSLTLTMDTQIWGDQPGKIEAIRAELPVTTVRRAEDLGADAVKVLFPWGLGEAILRENILMIAQIAEEADREGFPLMLEPLWMGPAVSPEEHDQIIVHGARISLELGADILKVPALGSKPLAQILAWEVPTVFLGGAKQDDPKALYARIKEGLQMGARGLVIGRNVWQRPDMDKAIAAIRELM